MSKWTELRDMALAGMKDGALNVTEQTKQNFVENFLEAGFPVLEQYAVGFVEAVKEQATTETGWMKIRDGVVIPFGVNVLLFVVRQLLEKTIKATN